MNAVMVPRASFVMNWPISDGEPKVKMLKIGYVPATMAITKAKEGPFVQSFEAMVNDGRMPLKLHEKWEPPVLAYSEFVKAD